MSAVRPPLAAPAAAGAPRAGRFALTRVLGRGAQATVWLGFDPRLEREVAVKVIDPRADAAAVAQWLDEARAVSRLTHPGIVPVFEADQDGASSFMVFELVAGPTLAEVLKKRGALPEREAAQLTRDVLDALAAAHAQGIVHRDLKPSNILIDAQGRPRVMDFGIAARVSARHDGRIVGSPGYIAPEAVLGGAPHPAMDVFAAGMLLARMLLGQPLLGEKDPHRALDRITREDLAWPDDRLDIDAALRNLVIRAVARDPGLRPASAAAFRDELARWLDPAPVGAQAEDSATFEFLLRRMRHKTDFPALSDAVMRIQRITHSDGASLAGVTAEIVRDVALTQKLLRLVNTAHFGNAGGGSIASVPRAVALVGLSGIRTMALSLVLLEHMQDKTHVQRLKEVFLLSLMTGTLVDELTPSTRLADEPFLAGMMSQLGRMLVEFYLPEEAHQIRSRTEPAWQKGEWSRALETRVVTQVLGLDFEALGTGVARVWGLPVSLQRAITRPEGEPPGRAIDAPPERLRWCVTAADEIAQTLLQAPAESGGALVRAIGERYARALNCKQEQFDSALKTAQSHLQAMATDLGMDLKPESRAHRLMPSAAVAGPSAVSGISSTAEDACASAPDANTLVLARPAEGPSLAERMLALEQGIAQVTNSLAGDSFRLNEVLRTILDALHEALGFRCVLFGLRDPKSGVITGRFGLGEAAAELSGQMRVDVNPGAPADLLTAACRKGVDTLIADARADNILSRLPTWLQRDQKARSFLLLPMTMKNAPFALIYADRAEPNGIVLGERELSLVRTLRNQAVMAFKTAA